MYIDISNYRKREVLGRSLDLGCHVVKTLLLPRRRVVVPRFVWDGRVPQGIRLHT